MGARKASGRHVEPPSSQQVETPAPDLPGPLNQGYVRQANAWTVLSAVRQAGLTSRSQVSQDTGLTTMTVHRLMTDLRRRRLVRYAGRSAAGAVGRPASLFEFNAAIGCVAGIDVGNETARFVLTDLGGRPLAQSSRPSAELEADLARAIATEINSLQAAARVAPDSLVGTGVGVPAVVDGDGTVVRASQHRTWDGLALGALLRETLGSGVVVRQDDHLAALAELRRGQCAGTHTAIVLDVGKGIGVGIIADGAVHAGAHAAAGRVGWIPMPVDSLEPWEATLLGSRLTGDGLVAAYREKGGEHPVNGALDVFIAADHGDIAASAAIDAFASHLGWLVGALVAVLDPQIVVIGGGISRSYARLEHGVTNRLAQIVPSPPPVVASALVPDAVVVGALEAAQEVAGAWLRERIGI